MSNQWIDRHHKSLVVLSVVALVLAVVSLCLTVYLASAANSTRKADHRAELIAKHESAEKIGPPLCHMVWAYQHPDKGTNYPPAIVASWSQIGAEFLNCPFGTKP